MMLFIWAAFILFILGMLAVDLGLLHRNAEVISPKAALRWSGVCVILALLANIAIYFLYENHVGGLGLDPRFASSGKQASALFFTGWLVEQSLSLDNVFLIAVIFAYFRIPLEFQHRVLFWGIIGALVMRGAFVGAGAYVIQSFSWANYIFGAVIIYAAIKMLFAGDSEFDPHNSRIYRLVQRFIPSSPQLDGQNFFTRINGKVSATPLLYVLILIETTDILFAVDSIPAVFAITSDPFLVFTSNIFAILNLRSTYFALALLVGKFERLSVALAAVLLFVGLKMVLDHVIEISTGVSLSIIVGLLAIGVLSSIWFPPKKEG